MARRRRRVDAVTEQFWRGHVADQAVSQRMIRVYCGEHGLSEPSFYGWRREIARQDRAGLRSMARERVDAVGDKADFVQLEVRPEVVTAPSPIEIVLPDGSRVLVRPCHARSIASGAAGLAGRVR
jgi:hypothetical protein